MNKSAIQKRMENLAERGWHPSLRLMADGSWRVCLMRGSHKTRQNIIEDGKSPEMALYRAGCEVYMRERRQGPRLPARAGPECAQGASECGAGVRPASPGF